MKLVKGFFTTVFIAIAYAIMYGALLTVSAWLGFAFGLLLELTASNALGGENVPIPTITAWLFVLAALIGARKVEADLD